jgi:hypothetical protein
MRPKAYLLLAVWCGAFPALAQTPPRPQVLHFENGALQPLPNQTSEVLETSEVLPVQASQAETLVPFDYRTAEIRWIDNRWQLLSGGVWLKDFGKGESDAREALRLIRDMRLTQHGTIGSPRSVMEYWLADGLAPQGSALGQRLVPIDPASLRVEKVQEQWCLRDARRLLFVFGGHEADARQAFEIIHRHGFTQVGYIGHPVPAMTYFLGGHDGLGQARLAPPATLTPRRHSHEKAEAKEKDALPQAAQLRANPLREAAHNPLILQAGHQLAPVNPLAGDRPTLGDRVAFDGRQVRLRQDGNDWKLCSGDYTVANFGPSEYEARRGINAIQFYRLNEHCRVGESRTSFSFFLANGQSPRGLMFGLTGRTFRPQTLTIRQVGGGWAICDDKQPLIALGEQVDDAKKLLEIIQQHKFDHLCHIGPGEPYGMTLLIRGR